MNCLCVALLYALKPITAPIYPIILGIILVLVSYKLPKSGAGLGLSLFRRKGGELLIPEKWNEREIARGFKEYHSDGNILSRYVEGIITRFVAGQDARTMEARTKFLQQFNRYAEVNRQSYKWQRYMQGERAKMEEDIEDLRVQTSLERMKTELEGVTGDQEAKELKKQIERLNLRRQLATAQKEMDDMNRPAPPPPPSAPAESSTAKRERMMAELKEREKKIKDEIRETQQDDTLDEDTKERKLNLLRDRLVHVHERQAELL